MPAAKRKRTSTATQADPVSDTEPEQNDHEEQSDGADNQPDETPFTEGGVTSDSALPAAECPFTVIFRTSKKPKGKKAKKHRASASSPAGPPPSQSLDQELPEDQTVFSVKPKKSWDSLKKYRNFVGKFLIWFLSGRLFASAVYQLFTFQTIGDLCLLPAAQTQLRMFYVN